MISSSRKDVSLYEYMDAWGKFNETSLPEKEDVYSHLSTEEITDADYAHAKRVCKDFEIKTLREYHDLYVQRNTLLLAVVIENFRIDRPLEILRTWLSTKILSAPGLVCQGALKTTKLKLDLLADIDMLLMVEKVLEEEYVTLFVDIQKLITNTWKIMIKIKNCCIFNIGI